jgi:hypothetical protein
MTKHMLSEPEKAALVQERYKDELVHNNGMIVTVSVKDETDENGKPSFIITRHKNSDFHSDVH